jgi:hypothetical protein
MTLTAAPSRRRHPYSVHPDVLVMQRAIAALPSTTGRSLDDWIALVRGEAPAGTAARRAWLARRHGLRGSAAGFIVERAEGRGLEETDSDAYLEAAPRYVEALFSGPKTGLRPVFDALVEAALGIGRDVRVCPSRRAVFLYRTHAFGTIHPAVRGRLELGLALGTTRTPKRLTAVTGRGPAPGITHRMVLARGDDVDTEVRRWLRIAYELDR